MLQSTVNQSKGSTGMNIVISLVQRLYFLKTEKNEMKLSFEQSRIVQHGYSADQYLIHHEYLLGEISIKLSRSTIYNLCSLFDSWSLIFKWNQPSYHYLYIRKAPCSFPFAKRMLIPSPCSDLYLWYGDVVADRDEFYFSTILIRYIWFLMSGYFTSMVHALLN
jgi:hypothetical protein